MLAGQAQKEFFVNEALARIDMLLHPVVEGERAAPPADPAPGESWLVAADPTDAWAGRAHALASWDGAQWTLIAPQTGCLVYDRAAGVRRQFRDGWQYPARPDPVTGGTVVDAEARAAIAILVDKLATVGVFPSA